LTRSSLENGLPSVFYPRPEPTHILAPIKIPATLSAPSVEGAYHRVEPELRVSVRPLPMGVVNVAHHGRNLPAGIRRRVTSTLHLALALGPATAAFFTVSSAQASPEADGRKGLALARKGECVEAMPLLESAEGANHRPETAVALADCYVQLGALLNAKVLYDVVALETPERSHTRADRNAIASVRKKLKDVETRIPTLAFTIPAELKNITIKVNDNDIDNPTEPHPFDPNDDLVVTISAPGRKTRKETITLEEREHRVFNVELDQAASVVPAKSDEPRNYLGVNYRGYLVPGFLTNIFGEGGRTFVAPGAGLAFTRTSGAFDLTFSLDYMAFSMGPTPFKPAGTPDTEYEILQSDLASLHATLELHWNLPLDKKQRIRLRIGGGLGFGVMAFGNLYRTQAYPTSFVPGDPYTYLPCQGPNNPAGSFRYCNELDKDADRYPGYTEPSWFDGGIRPTIYPWIALPMVGLSFRPSARIAIDIDVAPAVAGLLTSVGARVGF
jgi:hypothetical protein